MHLCAMSVQFLPRGLLKLLRGVDGFPEVRRSRQCFDCELQVYRKTGHWPRCCSASGQSIGAGRNAGGTNLPMIVVCLFCFVFDFLFIINCTI